MDKFYLGDQLNFSSGKVTQKRIEFLKLCEKVKESFLQDWEGGKESIGAALNIQKKAIIGYEQEVSYFKGKIREVVKDYQLNEEDYPPWYESLDDGIYHENWGLAGIAEWFSSAYAQSSSAKIIGNRVYFLENGRMCLKPQQISKERREQLIRAFLLLTPEERLDKEFHEIYMLDGTRVTIYGGQMTKQDQDVIIFRRYIIPVYRFEEQAERGTIPKDAIKLFEAMVHLGYNTAFIGAVRSAKTTFLSTWQSYEDPSLEGVLVETDPEIPLHHLMPEAPILQILADNEKMKSISKNLLRSDADYFILAEARDGIALDTAIKIASKGTRRMKITFHARDPLEFCYDVAGEIVKSLGGELEITAKKVAASFDYVFHFVQLKNKNQKRLNGIYELCMDRTTREIQMKEVCKYDQRRDCWTWNYMISEEKKQIALEEDLVAYEVFEQELKRLAGTQKGEHVNDPISG